jgi:class 3 adenylate cyclase
MSKLIEQFKERVVDARGDNLLAEFGSVDEFGKNDPGRIHF